MSGRTTNPDLQAALDALPMPTSEPFIGETLAADGWVYKDVPTWFSRGYWDKFLTILGDGQYRILAASTKTIDGEKHVHAQFFLSPTAMENLRNYSASQKP